MNHRSPTRRSSRAPDPDASGARIGSPATEPEDRGLAAVRKLLLALVLFGSLGLLLELLLLEHYESPWQWTPLTLLSAGIVAGAVLWARPGRRPVLLFRWLMMAFIAASLLGMTLHYRSNAAFEREMDSTTGGLTLIWYAIRGSTPALAPGALLQLGILGLILVYRHPVLRRARGADAAESQRG